MQPNVAFLWDESFLWGLMAYNALRDNGLPFELIRSQDIKSSCLKNYKMLFVPGGWASNKIKTLGDAGVAAISDFVRKGGNYLGFCGGAGLATLDGMGLLNIKRKPTKDRVPSFSGRIHLNTNEHPVWNSLFKNSNELCAISDGLSEIQNLKFNTRSNPSLAARCSPLIFHAWWPSQFLIDDQKIKTLATYGSALPDSFSSDLNVGDIETNGNWEEMEKIYKIKLNPKRLLNDPAVAEGAFGKGRIILSLVHFDTPGDANGAIVLKNLWEYLTGQKHEVKSQKPKIKKTENRIHNFAVMEELETAASELINLGERNFLWFWRNPMLLQWRRGIRGLEYCTLYVLTKEIAEIVKGSKTLSVTGNELPVADYALRIKELLIPFVEKAKQLLILERHALQNGHITPLTPPLLRGEGGGEYDPEIQKIRTELFSNSKSHGGLFKKLIDEVDGLLYSLLKHGGQSSQDF